MNGSGGGGAGSRSQWVTETVNGSHSMTIRGYSLAKGMGVGKHIASDSFSVGGYDWAIYFYPDGKNPEDNAAYVSVFIALASDGSDVRALFELTLLDQSDHRPKHKVHSHFDRSLDTGPYTLKYRGSMWSLPPFSLFPFPFSSSFLNFLQIFPLNSGFRNLVQSLVFYGFPCKFDVCCFVGDTNAFSSGLCSNRRLSSRTIA